MIKSALKDAVKEFFRIVLIGIPTSLIPAVLSGINTESGIIDFDSPVTLAIGLTVLITAVGKAIDKFLHKWGVNKEGETKGLKSKLTLGLTRF